MSNQVVLFCMAICWLFSCYFEYFVSLIDFNLFPSTNDANDAGAKIIQTSQSIFFFILSKASVPLRALFFFTLFPTGTLPKVFLSVFFFPFAPRLIQSCLHNSLCSRLLIYLSIHLSLEDSNKIMGKTATTPHSAFIPPLFSLLSLLTHHSPSVLLPSYSQPPLSLPISILALLVFIIFFVCLSIDLSFYLSNNLSIYLFICPSLLT